MRFFLLFVLVTAPALFFLLNGANANIEEEGIGGEKEGVVSLETRLEFAEEAEREIESDAVFPAEASGGAPALKAIGAPLPQINFCPTGGISLASAPDYLKLANTLCVGGSWVVPKELVNAKDWAGIEALSREASQLAR